jgi:hypothetical protein
MSRGRSRQAGIPPARCGAVTHTRGGRPCRRFVQVGSLRCSLHSGAAPQALKKGDDRATIAQLMQHEHPDRPRPLGEVMLEAVHNADVLMRSLDDVRLRVLRREEVTGEELDRLVRMSPGRPRPRRDDRPRGGAGRAGPPGPALDGHERGGRRPRAGPRPGRLTSGPRAPLAPLGPGFIGDLRVWLHEVVCAELEAVAAVDDPDPDRAELVTGAPVTYPAPPALPAPG